MSSGVAISRVDEYRAAIGDIVAGAEPQAATDACAVDGLAPAIVVTPATEEDVRRALREATESGLAVIPVGGGAHLALGNVPVAYDVALRTSSLAGVVAYEPDDLTVTVQAGMPLAALQAILAEHGQFLPLDPAGAETMTAGGVVAANASGPLRHAFGTARDWVIGMRVAHTDGRISKSGGRVVKNVAGYEMTKLFTGSLGTLAVITELTFKLAPLARSEVMLSAACPSAREACTVIERAHDSGLALHRAEVLSPPASHALLGDARWCALLALAGGSAAIERTAKDLGTFADDVDCRVAERDRGVWDAWRQLFSFGPLSLRAAVRPSAVAETIDVLDRRFTGAAPMLSATVSAGLVRARLEPGRIRSSTLVAHARETVERRGGAVIVDSASPAFKRDVDVFGTERADVAIMRRIKDEFDPKRTLSPGRFLGRI
jgi:glycolate oxidase FAD binding subunit